VPPCAATVTVLSTGSIISTDHILLPIVILTISLVSFLFRSSCPLQRKSSLWFQPLRPFAVLLSTPWTLWFDNPNKKRPAGIPSHLLTNLPSRPMGSKPEGNNPIRIHRGLLGRCRARKVPTRPALWIKLPSLPNRC
jgi:hypothetical protein